MISKMKNISFTTIRIFLNLKLKDLDKHKSQKKKNKGNIKC